MVYLKGIVFWVEEHDFSVPSTGIFRIEGHRFLSPFDGNIPI